MTCKNKYYFRCIFLQAKFREIIKLFSLELTATQIAEIVGVNRDTINIVLGKIRVRLAQIREATSPLSGEI